MADNLRGPCRLSRADRRRNPPHHEERRASPSSCALQRAGNRCGLAREVRRIPDAAPTSGRTRLDLRMFFKAFAPNLLDDDVEMRRAVSGQPTWMKAADAGREYRVSARTLSQKTALGGFELGGLSSIRIRRTLLVRSEEIESRWPRRDQLMQAGRGISRKIENPDFDGPRMGAYAAANATTSGMTMTYGALGNLRRSGAVRAANQLNRSRTADFARNSARGLPAGADAGVASVVNEGGDR